MGIQTESYFGEELLSIAKQLAKWVNVTREQLEVVHEQQVVESHTVVEVPNSKGINYAMQ